VAKVHGSMPPYKQGDITIRITNIDTVKDKEDLGRNLF
jgi:hypothetical protein